MSGKDDRHTFLLGVGLDGQDGHHRQTKADEYLLVGGSEETHELLQEHAAKICEALDRRGMKLADVDSRETLREIAKEAGLAEPTDPEGIDPKGA
jgi:hypothetical protein